MKRHFHHAHGAFHDLLPGIDDGGRLLPLQHGRCDLRCVRKMSDPHFLDLDAGVFCLLLQFLAHDVRDLLAAAPQGFFIAALVGIVGILSGRIPDDGVALDGQIVLIIFHIDHSFGRIYHPPDHHGSDLHRITQQIVDLLLFVVQGHHPQGHFLSAGGYACGGNASFHTSGRYRHRLDGGINGGTERIHPEEAFFFDGSVIITKQSQHIGFIGVQHLQSAQQDHTCNDQDDTDGDANANQSAVFLHAADHRSCNSCSDPCDQK